MHHRVRGLWIIDGVLMQPVIHLEKSSKGEYTVRYAQNMVVVGHFLMDVDGYYKFFPKLRGGFWTGYVMRAIADAEDEINKEWNDKVMNDPSIGHGEHDLERRESI